jgi:hypothetical protein
MPGKDESKGHLKMKAEAEIEEVQFRLDRAESSVGRAKGLIALASSFLDRGEYAEATNLAILARLELSRLAPTLTDESAASGKKVITYQISKTKEPEEALWVSQSERVVFIHSLETLVDALDFKMSVRNEPSGVMVIVLKKGDEEIATLHRSVEVKEDGIKIRIEVECDDREMFKAIFLNMKEKFAEISHYLQDVKSDPPVPSLDKDDFIAHLKEREQADVEEILVLHDDGRLMCHISSAEAQEVDYDILGSMILALQSFVRDSFRKEFDELGFSGKKILLVPGKSVKVAFVLKGEPTDKFKKMVLDSIVKLEKALDQSISAWRGEMTIANDISPYLEVYVRGGRVLIGGA